MLPDPGPEVVHAEEESATFSGRIEMLGVIGATGEIIAVSEDEIPVRVRFSDMMHRRFVRDFLREYAVPHPEIPGIFIRSIVGPSITFTGIVIGHDSVPEATLPTLVMKDVTVS